MDDFSQLKQQIEALEQEWSMLAVVHDVEKFETDYFEQQVSNELGVIGALAIGVGLLDQTLKSLFPLKVSGPLVTGCWALGGAYCLYRLTASTVSSWANMTNRNARRKRQLQQKLKALEDRIEKVARLATGLPSPERPSTPTLQTTNPDETDPSTNTAASGPGVRVPAPHKSPTGSESSAELVEMSEVEEESNVVLVGQDQEQSSPELRKKENRTIIGGGTSKEGEGLDSLRQYAALGKET